MTDELPGVRIPTGPMSGAATEPVMFDGSREQWDQLTDEQRRYVLVSHAALSLDGLLRKLRTEADAALSSWPTPMRGDLMPEELEVLGAAARGERIADTAERLGITIRALRAHRLSIRRKAGDAPSIVHAIVLARNNGVLGPEEAGQRLVPRWLLYLGDAAGQSGEALGSDS